MEVVERMRFSKNERLFLKNDISRLFDKGKSFVAYPLRVVYLSDIAPAISGISVLISVPKKRIKRAVGRNRMKRLIREAFRLQKNTLTEQYAQNGKYLHIAFMYISHDLCAYSDIEKAVNKAIIVIQKKEK